MKTLFALLSLALLAACGVDGAPKPPAAAADSGVTITGEGRIGATAGL